VTHAACLDASARSKILGFLLVIARPAACCRRIAGTTSLADLTLQSNICTMGKQLLQVRLVLGK